MAEDIPLKDHLDQRIADLKENITQRFDDRDKAVSAALTANDSRLDVMNEFRQTISDQASMFVTRDEMERDRADIRELRESRALLAGKASGTSVIIGYGISFAALALALANFFMSRKP